MSKTSPAPGEVQGKRMRQRQPGSGGTEFYRQRGLPFVSMTAYRERRRDPDSQHAVELSNELSHLTERFPRFQIFLNQVKWRVLLQARKPAWKARTVLKCLRSDQASSINELIDRTKLDYVNVGATLEQLKSAGLVVECNRAGGPVKNPDAGRRYWRRKS